MIEVIKLKKEFKMNKKYPGFICSSICQHIFHPPLSVNCHNKPAMMAIHQGIKKYESSGS